MADPHTTARETRIRDLWPDRLTLPDELIDLAIEADALAADLAAARAREDTLRKALAAAREGIVALYQAPWDNLRRDIATEALATLDAALTDIPATEPAPCRRCGGSGYVVPTFAIGLVDPLPRYDCPECGGRPATEPAKEET